MTAVWLETLLKAMLIGVAGTWAARQLCLQINHLKGRSKVLFTIFALLPLTIPPLLPAYSYSAFSFNFQTQPVLNEILYCILLIFRVAPIGLILFMITPSAFSKSNLVCEGLLGKRLFSNKHRKSQLIAISALLSLFAFHDYETASLLRINHWTVVLFNAHAGGLVMNLSGSFQMILLPLLTSLALTILAFFALKKCQGPKFIEAKKNYSSFIIVTISLSILLILPTCTVLRNGLDGFKDSLSDKWMITEVCNSLALTIVASTCCVIISFGLLQLKKQSLVVLIPGLSGALILGLIFISLFNLPLLNTVKQTIIPLCLAMVVYGMPFATLICIAIQKYIPANNSPINLLSTKNRKIIKWDTIYQSSIIATIPLFCFLWFDLTLSSMLAPASVTTLFPRLYNLMHYSENEKLSATVILTTLIPFSIYTALYITCKTRVLLTSRTSVK